MPVPKEFDYVKPTNLEDTLSLLANYGKRARILAGGTDLTLKIKEGLETPELVIDLKGLSALNTLACDATGLAIGALTTFARLLHSEVTREMFPLLSDAAGTVGSCGIRNRATLCGNLCSAVPSLDSGPALLLYEAVAIARNRQGERRIPLGDWFVGPKRSALQDGELLLGLHVPFLPHKAAGCYVKLGRYAGEDLAQAGVGVLVFADLTYRVAVCAVGPVPKRAAQVEACLHGRELTDDLLTEAKARLVEEIAPITDLRASKEYRSLMVQVMLERGLRLAVARLRGEATPHGALWV